MLHVEACPHLELARRRVDEALARVGADAGVRTQQVSTAEQAERWGFAGSPTILVDGSDPFPAPPDRAGLACRLYPTDEGAQGAPTVEQLVTVLER